MAYAADSTSFNPVPVSVKASAGGGVPVGTVVAWPVASNPSDAASWLECNGQSTAGYPELAAVVGANVPNYQGLFLRGRGGDSAGLGVRQGDAIRNITGSWYGGTGAGGTTGFISPMPSGAFSAGSRTTYFVNSQGGYTAYGIEFNASNAVPTANENRPVNMAVRYLIRARP